jgi:hypothetical protein
VTLLMVAGLAGPVAAHANTDDHGSLSLLDEADGEGRGSTETGQAPVRLACEFWVRGENTTNASGSILGSHGGGRDTHTHEIATWNASEGSFEVGPLKLHADGDWLLQATTGDANHSTLAHDVEYTTCEDHREPLPGNDPHECHGPPQVQAYPDGRAIVVNWDHHQDPEDTAHFEVYRSQAGDRNFTSVARVDANETVHRDVDVEPGTEYVYTVTARDAQTGREGEPCDHARVTARGDQPPACPENLQAQARENGDIALDWKPVDGADTYKVYRSTSDEFYQIATVQEPGHVDPDTHADTTYKYRVSAADEGGEAQGCPTIGATAVPSFSTALVLALGAIAGTGTYVAARRWR